MTRLQTYLRALIALLALALAQGGLATELSGSAKAFTTVVFKLSGVTQTRCSTRVDPKYANLCGTYRGTIAQFQRQWDRHSRAVAQDKRLWLDPLLGWWHFRRGTMASHAYDLEDEVYVVAVYDTGSGPNVEVVVSMEAEAPAPTQPKR